MIKTKTIDIGGRDVTVKELRNRHIRRIYDLQAGAGNDFLAVMKANIEEMLGWATDLKPADLEDMTPSQVEAIWDAFREVNDTFFRLAQTLDLGDILKTIKSLTMKAFMTAFSNSLRGAFASATETPGNTVSTSPGSASKNTKKTGGQN